MPRSLQLERVRALMADGAWRSLAEIATATGAPESSISAQLRHLRKPGHGSWGVEKRSAASAAEGRFEYRLVAPGTAVRDVVKFAVRAPGPVRARAWFRALRALVRAAKIRGLKIEAEVLDLGRWLNTRGGGRKED